MSAQLIEMNGRHVALIEEGSGAPLVYLHGYADVHGVAGELMPFHKKLAQHARLIAPAHPGCNGTDDMSDGHAIEDAVFHYLQVFDALGLEQFDLVGHSAGGWIAAEIAVRHPEKVKSLTLIGACGLFVSGHHIADIFMHTQPERGVEYTTMRHMLFSSADAQAALRYYPDGRGDIDEEVRRYQVIRFSSYVGFKPPYLYNRSLVERLHRAKMPARVIWGEHDHFVPREHGLAYAKGLPDADELLVIKGAGHAAHVEAADEVADAVLALISGKMRANA